MAYTNRKDAQEYAEKWHLQHRRELRDKYFQRTWNLSLEEFEELIDEQEGKCAICEVELLSEGYKNNSACIDHDHKTGAIRGILCRTCNRGIGLLKDDAYNLRKAAKYIERGQIS